LRGKIRPDEAEAEDCGGSTFEADNLTPQPLPPPPPPQDQQNQQ
jgi:hypothetical protein